MAGEEDLPQEVAEAEDHHRQVLELLEGPQSCVEEVERLEKEELLGYYGQEELLEKVCQQWEEQKVWEDLDEGLPHLEGHQDVEEDLQDVVEDLLVEEGVHRLQKEEEQGKNLQSVQQPEEEPLFQQEKEELVWKLKEELVCLQERIQLASNLSQSEKEANDSMVKVKLLSPGMPPAPKGLNGDGEPPPEEPAEGGEGRGPAVERLLEGNEGTPPGNIPPPPPPPPPDGSEESLRKMKRDK